MSRGKAFSDDEVDEIRASADNMAASIIAKNAGQLDYASGADEIARKAFDAAEALHLEYLRRYGRRP